MRADLSRIQQRAARACAELARMDKDIADLRREVGLAKARLALKDDATAVLETVRDRMHQRAVGSYEALLTRLLRETLPEQSLDARIKVELSTKRGVSSISFLLERAAGECESVFSGNGGALTNIVSAGLRLIALYKARHTLRPFLVLDEPDCWLAPERIPAFYGVISQAARELGLQVLVITHHDPGILTQMDATFVRLLQAQHGISVDNDPVQWEPGQPGLRSIRLLNYRSHADSFIALSPGVTVLTGRNNIGKSAVIDALRAVAYGEGSDDAIRHGQDACQVEIDAGDKRLVWTRSRKGNPKEMYATQTPAGDLQREEARSRGDVPSWFSDDLGLRLLGGIDVQIGLQKRPVFLLDEPAAKQAAILSAGKEAEWIDRIFATYKSMVSEDNATVRKGEDQLSQLIGRKALLPEAHAVQHQVETLVAQDVDIDQGGRAAKEAADLLAALSAVASSVAARTPEAVLPAPTLRETAALSVLIEDLHAVRQAGEALAPVARLVVPRTPELDPAQELGGLLRELSRVAPLKDIPLPPASITPPEPHATEEGRALLREMAKAQALCAIPHAPEVPRSPEIEDLGTLREALDAVRQARDHGLQTKKEIASCDQDVARAAAEAQAAQDAAGGACPACGRPFGEHHAHP